MSSTTNLGVLENNPRCNVVAITHETVIPATETTTVRQCFKRKMNENWYPRNHQTVKIFWRKDDSVNLTQSTTMIEKSIAETIAAYAHLQIEIGYVFLKPRNDVFDQTDESFLQLLGL
jgi:hypothetical protein